MNLDYFETIFQKAIASQSEAEFCHQIELLLSHYEVISVEVGRGQLYWRARIIEGPIWENLSDLDYPPPEKARRGRLNDAGASCFYVSHHVETALREIEAQEGQLIQVAGFRVAHGQRLRSILIGEYANVQKQGYMRYGGTDPDQTINNLLFAKKDKARSLLYIDKFFAHVLSDPNARASNYVLSRALGARLHAQVEADGIVFPSVRDVGGTNLAVQPKPSDRVFQNVACLMILVGKPRQFGFSDWQIVKSADGLDDDGKFTWPNKCETGGFTLYGLSKDEYDSFRSFN